MATAAFAPPVGNLPVLQYMTPAQLQVDASYQRKLDATSSDKLIREIAQHWDWALCLPLVVARRAEGGGLFVVDGQHRHAAACLRGDIQVLPCVILEGSEVELEARTFVRLNKQRRPISKLDEFRAAIAAGDDLACEIEDALARAGLKLAANTNYSCFKPGELACVGGLSRAWREHGGAASALALEVLARSYPGQILRFGGSIFPGIAAIIADDGADFAFVDELVEMVSGRSQADWRGAILLYQAEHPGTSPKASAVEVLGDAFDEHLGAELGDELEEAA